VDYIWEHGSYVDYIWKYGNMWTTCGNMGPVLASCGHADIDGAMMISFATAVMKLRGSIATSKQT